MAWAALGAGALGRLIGNLSDTYGTGDTLSEKKRKDAESDALYMERAGIQARVEGAKAAGLHPLVAMNYQGGYQPQVQVGGGPVQPIYDDPSRVKTDPNVARINEANARRAEAEASMAELNFRNANKSLATQPGQPRGLVTSDANAGLGSSVSIKPDEVVAGKGGHTAGTHQGMTRFEFPGIAGGLSLPSNASSQAMEDLELLKYAAILSANSDRLFSAMRELNFSVGKADKSYVDRQEARREVDSLARRYPPKGDWVGGRRAGGYVRY